MNYSFARPITLMKPERLVFPPAWVGHIPFAFWVVEAMRPRLFVELGTHTGNSFGAFTQAASSLSLDARFVAVDHWRGDEHAGSYAEGTFDEVRNYFDSKYSDVAELMRMNFDDAAPEFEDGSIDLLHIDGFHTYEAVKHDFENWLPKMSARGVVLLHDTAVRERDFGVFRLMDELSRQYGTFEFEHSHGLGVIQTGSDVAAAVKRLTTGEPDDGGIFAGDYFSAVGNALVGRAYAEILSGADTDAGSIEVGLGLASLRKQELEGENEHSRNVQAQLMAEKGRLTDEWQGVVSELEKVLAEKDRLAEENRLLRGEQEAQLGEKTRLADEANRLRATRDALAAEIPSLEGLLTLAGEYLETGADEAREPSPLFDPDYYLASNPDVAESGVGPLVHYLLAGRKEGRLPTPPAVVEEYPRQAPEIHENPEK